MDVTYEVDNLVPGTSHRVRTVRRRAGGKGVNVARVLAATGAGAVVLAPVGGAAGDAVRAAVPGEYVAKPNVAELASVVPGPLSTPREVATAAQRLVARGARNVVVSCGPDGLVAVTEQGTWRAGLPQPLAGNATGAGDALAAALALGIARGQ